MNKLIAAVALAAASLGVAAGPAEAHKITPRIIVGELQTGTINISPPTALDVYMWQGNLNGVGIGTRCANMGGHLGAEWVWGHYSYVCYHVDY